MKNSHCLLILLGGLAACAQEPEPASSPKADAPPEVEVFADDADFDLQKRTAIYRGNVRAIEPQMKLRCQSLTAEWSATNRITRITAEREVVVEVTDENGASRATGDRAVYDATTNEVEMTGHPRLQNKLGTMTCDRVILDRSTGRLKARGNVRMLMPAEALKPPGMPGSAAGGVPAKPPSR